MDEINKCSVDNCNEKQHSRGLCQKHYNINYGRRYSGYCLTCGVPLKLDFGYRGTPHKYCIQCKLFKIKEAHYIKFFGLTLKQYKEKIKTGCVICGFTKTVDLHHLNGNKDNSKLICLCPNHHQMIHRKHMTFEELKEEVSIR